MPAMMTIVPAKQQPEKVSAEAWAQIKKGGPKTLPGITALAACRDSKGGYVLAKEPTKVSVGLSLVIEDMPNEQLKLIVLAAGKRIGKKRMTRTQLITLAHSCVEQSVEIIDDGEDISDGEEAEA